ncbi:MAG TPA: DUF177 domain-containing protein [Alphaproteobacteria bacterium]
MTSHINEFQHNVRVDQIGSAPYAVEFEADARACEKLAKRFGILSVESLSGKGTLVRQSDGLTLHFKGHLEADVTQACVTTLEPVPEHVSEDFQAYFLDESQVTSFVKAKKKKDEEDGSLLLEDLEEQPIPEEHEDPEPVVGGQVDIGEIAAQYLSLALNPYPRCEKADKAPKSPHIKTEEEVKPVSPFAALKGLLSK